MVHVYRRNIKFLPYIQLNLTLLFSELKKVEKCTFDNRWLCLCRLPYWRHWSKHCMEEKEELCLSEKSKFFTRSEAKFTGKLPVHNNRSAVCWGSKQSTFRLVATVGFRVHCHAASDTSSRYCEYWRHWMPRRFTALLGYILRPSSVSLEPRDHSTDLWRKHFKSHNAFPECTKYKARNRLYCSIAGQCVLFSSKCFIYSI